MTFQVRLTNIRQKGCILRIKWPDFRKYPPEYGSSYGYCDTHGTKYPVHDKCPYLKKDWPAGVRDE